MSDSGGFAGISLLELFKLEAESHCAALMSGLLALEKNPGDASTVEPLMRAAHSIKGAARIIGLDLVGDTSHGDHSWGADRFNPRSRLCARGFRLWRAAH